MKVFAGLTGGISSGKSIVSDMFEKLGAGIVDADVLSRKVIEFGTAGYAQIAQAFPFALLDGAIDRSKLREHVFGNNTELKKLNSIMHPLIKNAAVFEMKKIDKDVIILVAPLLFESGFNSLTQPNITVSCDTQTRINRLVKRDNITVELAKKILESQWTDKQRESAADIVIYNAGSIESLEESVKKIYSKLKKGK